jgi:hypothetical protein
MLRATIGVHGAAALENARRHEVAKVTPEPVLVDDVQALGIAFVSCASVA